MSGGQMGRIGQMVTIGSFCKIFLIGWVALIPALLLSSESLASEATACESALTGDEIEKLTREYTRVLEVYVRKTHDIPTQRGFADEAGVTLHQLRKYLTASGTPSQIMELWELTLERKPRVRETLRRKLLKAAADFFKVNFRIPTSQELAGELNCDEGELVAIFGPVDQLMADLQEHQGPSVRVVRNRVINGYIARAADIGRTPTREELVDQVDGLEDVEDLDGLIGEGGVFATYAAIKEAAMLKSPNRFRFVIDTDIYDQERTDKMMESLVTHKRAIITTAVAGAPVNRGFFNALLNYCRRMDCEIFVYPANMQTDGLDPILLETEGVHVITHTVELTPWLAVNRIPLLAKQINPLEGLDLQGTRRGQSQIIGNPKQHLKTLPTIDNDEYPHVLMSTGALTDPHYDAARYVQKRTDGKAERDHVMGAIVVERNAGMNLVPAIETTGSYHFRHIEFLEEEGGFSDLGVFYNESRARTERPEAVVLGDVHVGDTDQHLLEAVRDQILALRPKRVILHDLMNGHSISHHERSQLMTLAKRAREGKLNLMEEIRKVIAFINSLLAIDPQLKLTIVPSNHDDWLRRYLQSGQFMHEPENMALGIELANAMVNLGRNPLEYALTDLGRDRRREMDEVDHPRIEYPRRVTMIRTGENFKLGPDHRLVELGFHGHAGANGGRGSLRSFQRGADRIVYGHSHTYGRFNGVVNVGTSTRKVLDYSRDGMSSWQQTLALVSPHGEIQALTLHDGQFYADPDTQDLADDDFFEDGYPILVPNRRSRNRDGQVDQHGDG